jgi:hypothetical protein
MASLSSLTLEQINTLAYLASISVSKDFLVSSNIRTDEHSSLFSFNISDERKKYVRETP